MSEALAWLSNRVEGAPVQLRASMTAAVVDTDAESKTLPIAEQLALAASACLARALRAPAARSSALDLLTADALMTHACEAAAESAEGVITFARRWQAERFEQLLASRTDERPR